MGILIFGMIWGLSLNILQTFIEKPLGQNLPPSPIDDDESKSFQEILTNEVIEQIKLESLQLVFD